MSVAFVFLSVCALCPLWLKKSPGKNFSQRKVDRYWSGLMIRLKFRLMPFPVMVVAHYKRFKRNKVNKIEKFNV